MRAYFCKGTMIKVIVPVWFLSTPSQSKMKLWLRNEKVHFMNELFKLLSKSTFWYSFTPKIEETVNVLTSIVWWKSTSFMANISLRKMLISGVTFGHSSFSFALRKSWTNDLMRWSLTKNRHSSLVNLKKDKTPCITLDKKFHNGNFVSKRLKNMKDFFQAAVVTSKLVIVDKNLTPSSHLPEMAWIREIGWKLMN